MDSFDFDKNFNNLFSEEKENLNNNMTQINLKIKKLNDDVKKYWKQSEENRGDYEYLEEFKRCKMLYNDALTDLKIINELSLSPYFGHMYLESDEGDEDIFVGENSISNIDGKNIVYDWRSPVCSLFYANQNSIKFNQYKFVAKYKRQVEIKDKQLINCYELYNNKNSQVTDVFLKEVLKSKKNISGFTDIIKTIQDKQNEIIRLDLNKNIICQGVAGSGKTVIMIHRLSYLLYNNKNISPDNFLFIAPSDNFKQQLNNLNIKLGIDKIKLLTLYEYYIEKFNTYLNMFENEKYYIKEIIDDVDIDIKYNYSKECLMKKFKIIENKFLTEIDKIISKYNIKIKKEKQTCFAMAKQINDFLNERTKKYIVLQKQLKNELEILNDFIEKYENIDLNLGNNNSVNKVDENNIDEYKLRKNELEFKNKKIESSVFNIFRNNIYKRNLEKIEELNRIINISEIEILYKKLNNLNKYVSISNNFKLKLDKFLIFLENSIELNNNDLVEKDQIIKSIININNYILELSEFNYEEDCLNLKKLRDIVIPRNVINICFEHICVGKYKLNTVFSSKKYYRNDIFTIIYILRAMGFNLTNQYKYIYIDEAQDYNDLELNLVKKLEKNSVLSIFGDFGQNVSHNSTLRKNWDGLKKTFNNDFIYYELNENYRNTLDVVEYCNKELKTNMLGIGIKGENVKINKFVTIDEVIKRAEITESIIITQNEKFLEYITNNSSVTCFDIKSIKGLEFKNVIVIDDGLNNNEKYVSFTRSLGNLEIYID